MTAGSNQAACSDERPLQFKAADMQNVTFTKASRRRRGYDEQEVNAFLHDVKVEMAQLVAERDALQKESAQLRHGEARRKMTQSHEQAVGLLAKAQQTADQYVAEAEQYSCTLVQDARQLYEGILAAARARASAILEEAASTVKSRQNQEKDRAVLEQEIADLRTFSKTCRTQVWSFFEALIRQIEQLICQIEQEWGQTNPGVATQQIAGDQTKDTIEVPVKEQPAQPSSNSQICWPTAPRLSQIS